MREGTALADCVPERGPLDGVRPRVDAERTHVLVVDGAAESLRKGHWYSAGVTRQDAVEVAAETDEGKVVEEAHHQAEQGHPHRLTKGRLRHEQRVEPLEDPCVPAVPDQRGEEVEARVADARRRNLGVERHALPLPPLPEESRQMPA